MFPACGEGKLEDTPPEPEGLMLVVCAPTRSLGRGPWEEVPGKIFVPPFSYLKIHHWWIFKKGNGAMGAILKKMAVFFKENALRVNLFLDGGDLEENGCFP